VWSRKNHHALDAAIFCAAVERALGFVHRHRARDQSCHVERPIAQTSYGAFEVRVCKTKRADHAHFVVVDVIRIKGQARAAGSGTLASDAMRRTNDYTNIMALLTGKPLRYQLA